VAGDCHRTFAIGLLPSEAQSPALSGGELILHVRVYNPAEVPNDTLDRALEETSRIFAEAGIHAVWDPGEPRSSAMVDFTAPESQRGGRDTRDFLEVRFVCGFPGKIRPDELGFALPAARTGPHVTVYYDRAEETSRMTAAAPHRLLGYALAHEMGHVLLASSSHAEEGIMKAVWTRTDFQRLATGSLAFLPREILRMRIEVSRRVALSS
jgi:hypothetical protein